MLRPSDESLTDLLQRWLDSGAAPYSLRGETLEMIAALQAGDGQTVNGSARTAARVPDYIAPTVALAPGQAYPIVNPLPGNAEVHILFYRLP